MTSSPPCPGDAELFNTLNELGAIDRAAEQNEAYRLPGDIVPAIGENTFMRRDKSQVVLYGRIFLDSWSYRLTPPQAVLVALMNGERTLDDISQLLQEYAGGTKGLNDFKVRRVLAWVEALDPNKGAFMFAHKESAALLRKKVFDPKDFLIPEDRVQLLPDLEKPISMMWMPTSACQTKCVYCYATRSPVPQSRLLSDTRVKELFAEAAAVGIRQVNLDGGDALCRENIPELLSYGTSLDLRFDLSTKCYVSKDVAKALYDAGLRIVQFGFDAPYPELFDRVVGKKGHFYRTIESIQNCVDAGIVARTNSILIQETLPYIRELVAFLHTLPLRDMKIAAAFRSLHRPREGLLLTEEQKRWLRRQVSTLEQEYPEGKIKFECQSDYLSMSEEEREVAFARYPRCGVGRESIVIAPDGSVVMCEQSPQTEELVVGSVRERSIVEVWQSDEVARFKEVTREQFEGTVCYDCEEFEHCFHRKGGCIILSMKAYGTRCAPHPACPRAPRYDIPLQ